MRHPGCFPLAVRVAAWHGWERALIQKVEATVYDACLGVLCFWLKKGANGAPICASSDEWTSGPSCHLVRLVLCW